MEFTVEELININDQFESAEGVLFERDNDRVILFLFIDNNTFYHYILGKREFNLILQNFYIESLNNIILATLEKEFVEIEIDKKEKDFPIQIILESGQVIYMNEEEHDFILEALMIQRGK